MIQSSTNETAFMEEADINSAQSTTRVLKAEALNISHCELLLIVQLLVTFETIVRN